jgi:hypothetical protein
MNNVKYAGVAADCGLGVEYFGDEYDYADDSRMTTSGYEQSDFYMNDQLSEYADDIGEYMRRNLLCTVKFLI